VSPIQRHEIPGRIVLTVGWGLSMSGVALLIFRLVG
jgi:hypothetical protein